MSGKDRRRYLTETVLDQEFLDWCADNLECKLEMIADIQTPTGYIRASDRNKYVGSTFYEALLQFPVINRTVGEWLEPQLQFSTLTLELSNADGRYNSILPGGASYGSWIGKTVEVSLGLAEVASSYKKIFSGMITEVAGVKRSVKSITIVARDKYDKLNLNFPTAAITRAEFPKLDDDVAGKLKPVIYGDYTVELSPEPAIVPTFILNGRDPFVTFKEVDVDIDIGSSSMSALNNSLDNNDPIQFVTTGTLPTGLSTGVTYYVVNVGTDTFQVSATMGGPVLGLSGSQSGSHQFVADPASARENVKMLISGNDLATLDTTNVWMKRQELYYRVPATEVVNIGAGNRTLEVKQNSVAWVGETPDPYLFDQGDLFFVRCTGKAISGGYSDNLVAQAKDMLKFFGGLVDGDFDASWQTYMDKASPAESNIAGIKSRVWLGEAQPVITYVLSMLEQVRLETFIDREQLLHMNALHFEDFDPAPTFAVKNWDVAKDTFTPQIDETNNFNRAQGTFDYHPDRNENARNTPIFRNSASISQVGKAISKRIVFPNLYVQADVERQAKEILKLASSMFESIVFTMTWRGMLLEIGDFVKINVQIGSVIFEDVPAMIREIGYDPEGLKIPIKVWSFALCPFPGYNPGYTGTVGGSTATITQE